MLNELAQEIHDTAKSKGWYDGNRGIPEMIALMHSELSEALEAYRDNDPVQTKELPKDGGKPHSFGIELADCIIRILDTCQHLGIDIDKQMAIKMAYNKTRPYRHGNKRA